MLTVAEVAKRLRVSMGTVYSAIADGRLKCHRFGRGRGAIRIAEEDLQSFIERSTEARSDDEQRPPVRFRHLKL